MVIASKQSICQPTSSVLTVTYYILIFTFSEQFRWTAHWRGKSSALNPKYGRVKQGLQTVSRSYPPLTPQPSGAGKCSVPFKCGLFCAGLQDAPPPAVSSAWCAGGRLEVMRATKLSTLQKMPAPARSFGMRQRAFFQPRRRLLNAPDPSCLPRPPRRAAAPAIAPRRPSQRV